MLLVVSSLYDPHVATAMQHWRRNDVHLLTCHDLAQPGWRLTLGGDPTLVVGGKRVAAREVRGILSRLPWVTAAEVPFVAEDDRDYAAAEMQAFLLALYARMPCPVVNKPTAGNLTGPAWSPERWLRCAVDAGLAVRSIVHRIYAGGALPAAPPPHRRVVDVVRDQVFGDAPEAFHQAARTLARAAGVDLLRVGFLGRTAEPVVVDADPWVDIGEPEVAAAVAGGFP